MIFTGNILSLKRNFYSQTGNFGFESLCVVDTTSGIYNFGFSGGNNTNLNFKLESGKIYWNDQIIHSYGAGRSFTLNTEFSSGRANIIKDGIPLIYGADKSTGAYDYFYFNRSSSSINGEIDINFSGDSIPKYYISETGNLLSSGQNAITGYFVNQSSWPIRIFDSAIQTSTLYSFGKLKGIIQPNQSGSFAYTGTFSDTNLPILTTFSTNFGNLQSLFYINNALSLNTFIQLTSPTDFSFNQQNILNRDVSWLNYSGNIVTSNFNTPLKFQFGFISGSGAFTGNWDIRTGVNISSLVSLKQPGQYNSTMISGQGIFQPNSTINLQINHLQSGATEAAYLIITGININIINPIYQVLTN